MIFSSKLFDLLLIASLVTLIKLNGYNTASLSLYSQCGGIGYTGSTQCPPGSYCAKNSDWWSQCNPGASPDISSTAVPPPPVPSTTNSNSQEQPSSSSSVPLPSSSAPAPVPSGSVPFWGQCGGLSYTGPTQCVVGATCLHQSDWYSQCQPTNNDIQPIVTGPVPSVSSSLTVSSSSAAPIVIGPNDMVMGYYWWTWSPNAKPPAGINMGVCFSGYVTVSDALRDCASFYPKLPGAKYLSLGGGNAAGVFTASALANIDAAISANALKGWQGVVYDIEEGDSGLASAFKASFANSKAKGLSVLVTTSHSRPYGITDGSQLMTGFFADSNIDYISPQLYTSGTEGANDFIAVGTMWKEYAKSKAKIVPSIVLGSRDFPTAQAYFANVGVTLAGYVQWTQ